MHNVPVARNVSASQPVSHGAAPHVYQKFCAMSEASRTRQSPEPSALSTFGTSPRGRGQDGGVPLPSGVLHGTATLLEDRTHDYKPETKRLHKRYHPETQLHPLSLLGAMERKNP